MGVLLAKPITAKDSADGSGPGCSGAAGDNVYLRYGCSAMQGWRTGMEDAHVCETQMLASGASLFCVFDGHGGDEVAKYCAGHLPAALHKSPAFKQGNMNQAMIDAYLTMDDQLGHQNDPTASPTPFDNERQAFKTVRCTGVGCTAVCALVKDDVVYVANAGDSRCVLSRKGEAIDMSIDHKPTLEAEMKRIIAAGGYVQCGRVNGNLNLTRSLGAQLNCSRSLSFYLV
eukprot:TRINITY_DN6837_c0_g1_i2.p1 TRINITY_DN6837_c0_g1~~TRINITY_DN6837_c0_g1_i2.p1  ORF type:complete len:229 (-),score=43.27 TRINITY_DN6837_c0_g1_i2:42-728(-)